MKGYYFNCQGTVQASVKNKKKHISNHTFMTEKVAVSRKRIIYPGYVMRISAEVTQEKD